MICFPPWSISSSGDQFSHSGAVRAPIRVGNRGIFWICGKRVPLDARRRNGRTEARKGRRLPRHEVLERQAPEHQDPDDEEAVAKVDVDLSPNVHPEIFEREEDAEEPHYVDQEGSDEADS